MLGNITDSQLRAIGKLVNRIISGVVSPDRRDSRVFRRHRAFLRTLTSETVSSSEKKRLLKGRYSLVPIMLRTVYLIAAILDETRRTE